MAGEERKPISAVTIVVVGVVAAVVAVAATVFVLWWVWGGSFQPLGLVTGSGNLVTEEEDFSDFTAVSVGYAFDVEISRSSSYNVNITADDNLFEYIEVSKTGNTLSIGLRWGHSYRSVTNRAEITMPDLQRLDFSGATHGSVEGFSVSHNFVAMLSGASSLGGGYTTTGDAEFYLSGGSFLELDGGATDLLISASGGSQLELSEFPVQDAGVTLSGASSATVNLDGRLDASLSGASSLLYVGSPTLGDINVSGGSSVGPKP